MLLIFTIKNSVRHSMRISDNRKQVYR